ncbi:MAG: hypothetical protein RL283_714 [Actinomycetota bacterium]
MTAGWAPWRGDDAAWDRIVETSDAPSLQQTGGWAAHRADAGWETVRLATRDGAAHAQALVRRGPAGSVVAWVPGGPVGALPAVRADGDAGLVSAVREATGARLAYVRINALREARPEDGATLAAGGWAHLAHGLSSGTTMWLDLRLGAAALREGLSTNWAHNLRRGEARNAGAGPWDGVTAGEIAALHREVATTKGIALGADVPDEATIASLLARLGGRVVVHRCVAADGTTLAMRAAAIVGGLAVDLLAATSAAGRKTYAAYAACWSLVEECARRGATRYDLAGVDAVHNKGVYDFKRGTGAREVRYLGEWDAARPAPVRAVARRMIRRQRPS